MTEDEQKKWENSGDEHFIKLTLSCKKCIFNLILAKSQNLPTGSWDYQNSLLGQDVFSLWGAFIPQKCTKRRESGFHYRITINLLHPLLQLSAINTFYQICVFSFFLWRGLFMKRVLHPLLLVRTMIFLMMLRWYNWYILAKVNALCNAMRKKSHKNWAVEI